MKKILITLGLSIIIFACGPLIKNNNDVAINTSIKTEIDLTTNYDDKVPVIINPGRFIQNNVIYRLPRVVQGTYEVSDFGAYVEDFKAIDYNGNKMTAVKIDNNSWSIDNAGNLDKITYLVNDTFDDVDERGEPKLFPPQGTNIESNNYVLNLHGFIGYFDSLKHNRYELSVTAPASFKRSSALEVQSTQISEDGTKITSNYFAPRYFDITDNPMMYGDLEVEEFKVGDITIVLSLYSPNKKHSAKTIKETIVTMMEAQKRYLGDLNATPRYDIFLYLTDRPMRKTGALEHHTSTIVVTNEDRSTENLANYLTSVVSHEFFHIVTPLGVHSEDIHNFDYYNPTFSKHLWMYEGLTEYFANHFQVYEGLMSEEELFSGIMEVIKSSKGYFDDAMSFTEMSENILEESYSKNYGNVYQKGALIGMCLDILIREGSNGDRSVLSLMKELSTKYGKHKPFEDDKIIEEIIAMTYPSVKSFFETHVIGSAPINYNQFLNKVGLEIIKEQSPGNYILLRGQPIVTKAKDKTIRFIDWVEKHDFWKAQGAQKGDIIKEINGTVITMENAEQVFGEVVQWQPGQAIKVTLERQGELININATTTPFFEMQDVVKPMKNASLDKLTLRKYWLKGK